MPVKYQRETDPAQDARTVRLGLTPFRRQDREHGGQQRYRLALLYIAIFAVLLLTFASAILERNAQRANVVQSGVGRIVALEAPEGDRAENGMGIMRIVFPVGATEPARASWEVPFDLWEQLAIDDRVAVRYEGGHNASYQLRDAGYVALSRDDAID